ncbi:hypothetical protein NDN16_08025 [Aureimonas altamirensis]|uniref:hypothetical protein n=1 Tax=Aureimonas altamirensis TaxID=370622 RepID=UPI002037276A|nr:hypothetical protein [Aureimonas altamirensis]MCM2503622.1 hypothetical protein [Aureimonas altamirensis]
MSIRTLALVAVLGLGLAGIGHIVTEARADQPEMEAAISELRSALDSLRAAEPNKGGHRERAIELIEQAIAETQAGIDFAAGR